MFKKKPSEHECRKYIKALFIQTFQSRPAYMYIPLKTVEVRFQKFTSLLCKKKKKVLKHFVKECGLVPMYEVHVNHYL